MQGETLIRRHTDNRGYFMARSHVTLTLTGVSSDTSQSLPHVQRIIY